MSSWARVAAAAASLGVVALTLSPAFGDPPTDSFPLSTYPMFSTVRGESWVHVVVGVDASGASRPIDPSLVANAEVMQAAQTIARAVRRRRARPLCEEIAARVARDPGLAEVTRLVVESRRFDPRTYFAGDREPLRRLPRARCEVPR